MAVKVTYTRVRFNLATGTQTTVKKAVAPLKPTAMAVKNLRPGIMVSLKMKDPVVADLADRVKAIFPALTALVIGPLPAHDWQD
jgi:hypothetical protein